MSAIRYLPLAGRLLVGLPFFFFGFAKATTFGQTTAMVAAAGLPVPALAALSAVTLEMAGGLLLILGYKVRPAALLLALFSLLTAFLYHSNLADQNTLVHFLKNVIMTGGLLQITAFGAGAFSIEARSAGRRAPPQPAAFAA